MKKKMFFILLVCLGIFIVSGCGGGGSDTPPADNPGDSSPTTAQLMEGTWWLTQYDDGLRQNGTYDAHSEETDGLATITIEADGSWTVITIDDGAVLIPSSRITIDEASNTVTLMDEDGQGRSILVYDATSNSINVQWQKLADDGVTWWENYETSIMTVPTGSDPGTDDNTTPPDDDNTTFQISEYFPLGQGDTWSRMDMVSNTMDHTVTVLGTVSFDGIDVIKVGDTNGGYQLFSYIDGLTLYKSFGSDDIGPGGWSQEVPQPPINWLPPQITVGTSNSYQGMISYSDASGATETNPLCFETNVEAIESITVPVGTFDCIRIKTIYGCDGSIFYEETSWLARGVGNVRHSGVNLENGNVTSTELEELVSATVNGVVY